MPHTIVTTKGFIIGSRTYGEAGKLLSIFTRDVGLIMAIAQGIRLERSKLRYAAQEYSFGEFSFVRGKEFWRLTDAHEIPEFLNGPRTRGDDPSSRIASLIKRLLQGEDPHPELFDTIFTGLQYIHRADTLTDEDLQTAESLIVARMLSRLGYIGDDKELGNYLESDEIVPVLLMALREKRQILNQHINKALKESHL